MRWSPSTRTLLEQLRRTPTRPARPTKALPSDGATIIPVKTRGVRGEWMIDRRPGYRELPPFHTTNSENMS